VIFATAYAESEDDFTLLPVGQLERNLDRGTGVQSTARSPGKPGSAHGSRIPKRAVAAQKLCAITGHGAASIVYVEKGNPVGELRVVGVAREQRAAVGVNFGDCVQRRFRPQVAENPFQVSGGA